MTAEELRAFIADVRAQADAALARFATVNPEMLRRDLRQEYEQVRSAWEQLLAMTGDEAVELHVACLQAGRELTPEELRGLIGKQ